MADLTDEELDRARAREAFRVYIEAGSDLGEYGIIAARLAREGWTPPKPVDPDLIEAREIAATANDQQDFRHTASAYRGGTWDSSIEVQATLTAIKQTKAKFAAVLDEVNARSSGNDVHACQAIARIRKQAGL